MKNETKEERKRLNEYWLIICGMTFDEWCIEVSKSNGAW
jgi:hypothetical protein